MNRNHLTLRDICICDYVQEWLEIPKKLAMPMYVDGIFGDGSLYLNFDGNEADPWDANVKDVYDIPIDSDILPHFGFEEIDKDMFRIDVGELRLCVHVFKVYNVSLATATISNKNGKIIILGWVNSIRKLQHLFYDETKKPLKIVFE